MTVMAVPMMPVPAMVVPAAVPDLLGIRHRVGSRPKSESDRGRGRRLRHSKADRRAGESDKDKLAHGFLQISPVRQADARRHESGLNG